MTFFAGLGKIYSQAKKEVKALANKLKEVLPMKKSFIISCESTADLPYEYLKSRGVSVIFYKYVMGGEQYEDNAERSDEARQLFYQKIKEGALPSTSQINVYEYEQFFNEILKNYDCDVLHLALGTGLTPSCLKAVEAAKNIQNGGSRHKITVIDSLCGSAGYGLLLDEVLDLRDKGVEFDKIVKYIMQNRNKIHHQFFATDLSLFRRSGRVSGLSAMLAGILDINPIMHLNAEGKIIAYSKVRGKKKSIQKTVSEILTHAENGMDYSGKMYVAHSNCPELAAQTVMEIEKAMTNQIGKIKLLNIGSIIASHCGQGTVAVFFHGDERK